MSGQPRDTESWYVLIAIMGLVVLAGLTMQRHDRLAARLDALEQASEAPE